MCVRTNIELIMFDKNEYSTGDYKYKMSHLTNLDIHRQLELIYLHLCPNYFHTFCVFISDISSIREFCLTILSTYCDMKG